MYQEHWSMKGPQTLWYISDTPAVTQIQASSVSRVMQRVRDHVAAPRLHVWPLAGKAVEHVTNPGFLMIILCFLMMPRKVEQHATLKHWLLGKRLVEMIHGTSGALLTSLLWLGFFVAWLDLKWSRWDRFQCTPMLLSYPIVPKKHIKIWHQWIFGDGIKWIKMRTGSNILQCCFSFPVQKSHIRYDSWGMRTTNDPWEWHQMD